MKNAEHSKRPHTAHAGQEASREAQWRELGELARQSVAKAPNADRAWRDLRDTLAERDAVPQRKRFGMPQFTAIVTTAAACLAIAGISLVGINQSLQTATVGIVTDMPEVEYAEVYYADTSPLVYTDEESGWAVVWAFEDEYVEEQS